MAAKTSSKKKNTTKKSSNNKSAGKGSSSNGKKSTAKGGAKKNVKADLPEEKKPKIKNNPAGSRMRDNIVAVLLVALGIFLIIAVLTDSVGEVGAALSTALTGSLGIMAVALPFYIIIYALLVLMGKMAHVNSRSVFFTLLMFIDMTMINSARFSEVKSAVFDWDYVKRMFSFGVQFDSAGAVGMTLGWMLVRAVDIVGMLLIGAMILVICVMLIVNTPISLFFDNRRIKKNQKKINALSEKTESGFADHKKDTLELDAAAIQREIALTDSPAPSRKRKTKPKPLTAGASVYHAEPEYPPEPAADSYTYYYDDPGLLTDLKEDRTLEEAAGLLGRSSREVSKMGRTRQQTTSTASAPMGDNRRKILTYVNDSDLFAGEVPQAEEPAPEPAEMPARRKKAGSADLRPLEEGRNVDDLIREFSPEFEGEDLSIDKKKKKEFTADNAAADEPAIAGSKIRRLEKKKAGEPAAIQTAAESGPAVPAEEDEVLTAMEEAAQRTAARRNKAADAAAAAAGAAVIAQGIQQETQPEKKYEMPPLKLLEAGKRSRENRKELQKSAELLESVLQDFGVEAAVVNVSRGPSVTRYEVQPATGVKVSKIVNLADDIALNLRAKSLRIEAPIPGKAAVGIEIENDNRDMVSLRDMIDSDAFRNETSKIAFAVGEDIAGNPVIANLKKMPHLLIAGSTGSGKSVCINSILLSILYRSTPDEVRLILIDPKVVELSNYNGIPHMLIPVVNNPAKAAAALAWAVKEMEDRYQKFAKESTREMTAYNKKMKAEGRNSEVLPQIVIIIDELADLMMAAGKQVEESICRLAQLARAAGMHMIVATQRPSVDVVTGLIKSNIPSRIAFAVSSQVDSRTIIDRAGAEKLIGNGDMLFNPLGISQPQRLQGPFVSDKEIEAVLDFWKAQADLPDPDVLKDTERKAQAARDMTETKIVHSSSSRLEEQQRILAQMDSVFNSYGTEEEEDDPLMEEAIALILDSGQASASMLQRRFRIGYNRAGRLIDTLEARGIIGPSEGSKPRKVLITKEEYYAAGAVEQTELSGMEEYRGADSFGLYTEDTSGPEAAAGKADETIAIPDADFDLPEHGE